MSKKFKQSAEEEKPVKELKLISYHEGDRYTLIENYLFDKELWTTGYKGIIYKPGLYMEFHKPNLEQFLIPETDDMYISINNSGKVDISSCSIKFGKTKYCSIPSTIIDNPEFTDRLNRPTLSNNQYECLSLKREIIEKCINSLKEKKRAVLLYFLNPNTTLETFGISARVSKEIESKTQLTRVSRLKKAIQILVDEIVSYQEGLR